MTEESAVYEGASKVAIQHHYDVGNEFYALWLDRSMTYSCALWEDADEELEVAQARKLDFLAEAARLPNGARVLEIGCGWGSLLRRLIDGHGAREVVGLTLSDAQSKSIAACADDRYTVLVENWIDHHPSRLYDAIISIGAFEHFAKDGLTRANRIAAYRSFFRRCRDWLPPNGRLVLQTIIKGGNKRMSRETVRDMQFVKDRIFPESELPWPAEILEASEGLFYFVRGLNDGEHYARTCRRWYDALISRRKEAALLVGTSICDDYVRYLRAAPSCFENRHVGLLRAWFERL